VNRAIAVFTAVLLSQGLAAQEPPAEAPGPPRARPEELFRMVDAYFISNLQEGLGLTDEQFVRLLPLVKRLQSDRRSFMQRRFEALRELRRMLEAGGASEARVGERLRELKALEAEEPAAIRKDMEAIDGALSPLQQAKFRVLEAQVEQRIRELMSRVRGRPAARPRAGRPEDGPE
jgi:Spy/CpxP family protein refolding chaperone